MEHSSSEFIQLVLTLSTGISALIGGFLLSILAAGRRSALEFIVEYRRESLEWSQKARDLDYSAIDIINKKPMPPELKALEHRYDLNEDVEYLEGKYEVGMGFAYLVPMIVLGIIAPLVILAIPDVELASFVPLVLAGFLVGLFSVFVFFYKFYITRW